jgi:hypothetical protein
MQTVFRSKVDSTTIASLMVAGLGAVAACIVIGGSTLLANWATVSLVFLPLVGFPVWILASTNYSITTNEIAIRSGPFSWKVPFRDITIVERSFSRRSGPALSMDRLRVAYGRGKSILISPDNKEAFLRELDASRHEMSRLHRNLQ